MSTVFIPLRRLIYQPSKKTYMKKTVAVIMILVGSLTSLQTKAQAFDKSSILLSLGIGPGEMIHFPVGNNYYYANGAGYTLVTGQLAFQAEFAVHKYVGVGFVVGIGGRAGYFHEVNVPIGVLANFHFYQLIADKQGGNLHADKVDVYAGLTAGSGVAIYPYTDAFGNKYHSTSALFYFGPHVGVNYYFVKNIAVNAEVGWGTTVFQAGVVFKLGGK